MSDFDEIDKELEELTTISNKEEDTKTIENTSSSVFDNNDTSNVVILGTPEPESNIVEEENTSQTNTDINGDNNIIVKENNKEIKGDENPINLMSDVLDNTTTTEETTEPSTDSSTDTLNQIPKVIVNNKDSVWLKDYVSAKDVTCMTRGEFAYKRFFMPEGYVKEESIIDDYDYEPAQLP